MQEEKTVDCVLVVEDDFVVRQGLALALGRLNIDADVAEDGVEALRLMDRKQYRVILLDLIMPRMTGLDVIRKITADRHRYGATVVVVTGADPTALKKVDRSVVKRVFVKPVDFALVAEEVGKICSG
jgi:DNA-binding response OmpR family regulator